MYVPCKVLTYGRRAGQPAIPRVLRTAIQSTLVPFRSRRYGDIRAMAIQ